MLNSLIKIALRLLWKHRIFSLLNILGLSIGIAASILILQYVKFEKSFDTFHSQQQNIYRVQYNMIQNGVKTVESAVAVPAVGPALKENYPEVKAFTRLYPLKDVLTYRASDGKRAFKEERMYVADPALFQIFDFELIKGDYASALSGSNKLVLTESAARKYFRNDDPIGKVLEWDSGYGIINFEVTGVLAEVPDNSHIDFDVLISVDTWNQLEGSSAQNSWTWYDYYTYILLEEGSKPSDFEDSFAQYLPEVRKEHWAKYNYYQEFIFQPLTDIHLNSKLSQEADPAGQGDADSVYFLTIIAFFILFIAYVNYVNLSTANSMQRANEVGIKKVLGIRLKDLWAQFFLESFLINTIAGVVAMLLIVVGWESFGTLTGRNIPLAYLLEFEFLGWILLLIVGGAFIAGLYPSFILTSFEPIKVLKGKSSNRAQGVLLRKILVIFQFAASIVLMSSTLVVYEQLTFMKNSDLGFEINNILIVEGPSILDSTYDNKVELFKNELSNLPDIEAVSVASTIPGEEITWSRGIRRIAGGPENNITVGNVGVDADYFQMFGIKVLAGRNFNAINHGDDDKMIINKRLSEVLEFENPEQTVGEFINMGRDTIEIIGVVENYHQMALTEEVKPISFERWYSNAFYPIKLSGNDQSALKKIEAIWNSLFPENPFDYFYLDTYFNRQYDKDDKFGRVFSIFSALAIFIGCLGLFGLALRMTVQRTKEIGIRKTLGSSSFNIVMLLVMEFFYLILIAALIACPLCWWLMDNWLETFPYRIEINPILFVLASFAVVIISFLSIGFQTFKAALINPAETLKYE